MFGRTGAGLYIYSLCTDSRFPLGGGRSYCKADDVGVRLGASVRARRCCTRLPDGCRSTAAALSSNDKVSEEGATAAVEDTDS